jgi:hypothetical protein
LSSLFVGLDKDMGYTLRDDRNGWQPAHSAKYIESKTGVSCDPSRVFPVSYLETLITMLTTAELGGVIHNMNLMAHALRIGGWPHFAGHPVWLLRLGFESDNDFVSRLSDRLGPNQARNDYQKAPVVYALKDKKSEDFLIKSYHPLNYDNSAEKMVVAFRDHKFGSPRDLGKLRPGGGPNAWRQEVSVKAAIPEYTAEQMEAAIDHVTYMYENYGRFPACMGPITSLTAFQAHHLDPEFYDKLYKPGVMP